MQQISLTNEEQDCSSRLTSTVTQISLYIHTVKYCMRSCYLTQLWSIPLSLQTNIMYRLTHEKQCI